MHKFPKEECEKRVVKCVKETCGDIGGLEPTMETKFLDDRLGDSLTVVEMIIAFEEEFRMAVPEEDADKWVTLGDIAQYAYEHQFSLC